MYTILNVSVKFVILYKIKSKFLYKPLNVSNISLSCRLGFGNIYLPHYLLN